MVFGAQNLLTTDRYRSWGLSGNPFQINWVGNSEMLGRSFVGRGIEPPDYRPRTVVQILGDSGFGKSTHLRYWKTLLPGDFHYVPKRPYLSRWHLPPVGKVIYGDEIDRMPAPLRFGWLALLAKRRAMLLVGTHRDITPIVKRFGFTVTTHELSGPNLETCEKVIRSRLGADAIASFSTDTADLLVRRLLEALPETPASLRELDERCHITLAHLVKSKPPRP